MSTDARYEAVFAHPGPWTEDEYFALPETPARIEAGRRDTRRESALGGPAPSAGLRADAAVQHDVPGRVMGGLPGSNVRLWKDHIRLPDVVVARSGLDVLYVPVSEILVLAEVTSPGTSRQDMIVKHTDYAEAGVQFYLRVDLHRGIDGLTASLYELVDGVYREIATAPDGVLRLQRPWPLEADLRALARGRR
jgi:Putative restriction endonuclease